MLDAAIQESLNTAREERDVAAGITDANASSSRLKGARNKAAALLAAAAEEGLELAEDQDSDFKDDLSDESEAEFSSEEEPLVDSKGKGKGKAKATGKKTTKNKPKKMTMKEIRRLRREERLAAQGNKLEERNLSRKLGRKLTYVRTARLHYADNIDSSSSGRKSYRCSS